MRPWLCSVLGALALLCAGEPAWARNWLDPFQAEAARAPEPPPPAAGGAAQAPVACTTDEQCPRDTICSEGRCKPIERRTNVLYLYYHEGTFTELLGLFWSKAGAAGYRVAAPFYWHYWSPGTNLRIFAPFFGRYESYDEGYSGNLLIPVVPLPIFWSHEPGAHSFALWPLLYSSTRYGWATPLLGSFTLADPRRQSSLGALGYLYWWSRSPERRWDLAFPLFFSRRSRESAFTYALPLNFYWRQGQDAHTLAIPLFYRHTHPGGSLTASLAGYHSSEGDNLRGALAWLYWYGRSPDSGYDVLFPLLWSFRSPESGTTVLLAPPFVHLRRKDWSFDTLLPVAFHGSTDRSRFTTVLPLFHWQTSDEPGHGRTSTLITLLGGYHHDDQSTSWASLVPPLFHRRDAERAIDMVALLFWRTETAATGSTTWLLPPLFYRSVDPEGSTTTVLGLGWHFHDAATDATATAVLPFFAHRAGPNDTSTFVGVFPLLGAYWRRFASGGWSAGLSPILFLGGNGDRGHAILAPLLWHFRDGGETATVAAPLFYRFEDRRGRYAGVLPLLWFQGDRGGESFKVQFPLFWRFASEREQWSTTVVPPFFWHASRAPAGGWSAGLAPLLFVGRDGRGSHFVALPLFWRFRDGPADETTTVAGLFYHQRHGGETTVGLFPLLHLRWGQRPSAPSSETAFTLFPLLHYHRTSDGSAFVSPVAAWVRKPGLQAGAIVPYFWYRSRTIAASAVPPLFFDVTTLARGERTRMFGPFFMLDAPRRRSRFLFPFVGRYSDARESDTFVFPSYFRIRKADGYALDTLFPIFWRSSWPGHETTIVGPWFSRGAPGSRSTGLLPLWYYAKGSERSVLFALPGLFYRRVDLLSGETRTSALLLFYRSTGADGHRTILFPLLWEGRDHGDGHAIVFPLFWRFDHASENASATLAGPFFWSHHGTTRTVGLLPLGWHTWDPATGASANALLPLFYESHSPTSVRWLTPLAGHGRSEDGTTWGYLLPYLSYESQDTRIATLLPLWFRHENRAAASSTTIVPPLLLYAHSTPERSLATVLALFWRRADVTSSTSIALPLYFDVANFHESRTTILLPFFLRYRDEAADTTTWLTLLFFSQSTAQGSSAFNLPLPVFWRFTSPGCASTIVFPLWWDFVRGDERTTVFFPFYWRMQRPSYISHLVLNIYFRRGAGPDEGTYRFLFVPLLEVSAKRRGDFLWEVLGGLAGYERVGRNRFAKVLFFNIELSPAPRGAISWYGRPRTTARRAPAPGLDRGVW